MGANDVALNAPDYSAEHRSIALQQSKTLDLMQMMKPTVIRLF
jgi:hypothetical protein